MKLCVLLLSVASAAAAKSVTVTLLDDFKAPLFHLNADNLCYETSYSDAAYTAKGYRQGPCDAKFNTVLERTRSQVCKGHSQDNIKTCPGDVTTVMIKKKGITEETQPVKQHLFGGAGHGMHVQGITAAETVSVTATLLAGFGQAEWGKFHLSTKGNNKCYESSYNDESMTEKGWQGGRCAARFNTVTNTVSDQVCKGHSEDNIKTCPNDVVKRTVYTKGISAVEAAAPLLGGPGHGMHVVAEDASTAPGSWTWEVTVDVFEGTLQGFFGTGAYPELKNCANDTADVYVELKAAITELSSKDSSQMKKGLADLGSALMSLKSALSDCKAATSEIEQLGQTLENGFKNPLSFVEHLGKDLVVNGHDIFSEITSAISLWKSESYRDSGIQIGEALEKLIVGEEPEMLGLEGQAAWSDVMPMEEEYHLSTRGNNICYESSYNDDTMTEKGWQVGRCSQRFNTVLDTVTDAVCKGHSEENVKYCAGNMVNRTVYTKGETMGHMAVKAVLGLRLRGAAVPNVEAPAVKNKYCVADADCAGGGYCNNGASKSPTKIWNCHGSAAGSGDYCTGDADCASASSYCMVSKAPMEGYFCHNAADGVLSAVGHVM